MIGQRSGALHHLPSTPRPGESLLSEDALVERLRALGAELQTPADPERRALTRSRLVAMAAVRRPEVHVSPLRRLIAALTHASSGRRRRRLVPALAAGAVALAAMGALLIAAQDTAPGDLLYGVKRGGEQTQLALASDASRGPTLLGFASERLTELEQLTREGASALPAAGGGPDGATVVLAAAPDVDLIHSTLATMDAQTTEGTRWLTNQAVRNRDQSALSGLAEWAADQRTGLAEVGRALPAAAAAALADSTDLLTTVADRGTALHRAVACAAGPATAGSDDLGPLPTRCVPVAAATRTPTTASSSSSSGTPGSSDPEPVSSAAGPSSTDDPPAPTTSTPGEESSPPAAETGSTPTPTEGTTGEPTPSSPTGPTTAPPTGSTAPSGTPTEDTTSPTTPSTPETTTPSTTVPPPTAGPSTSPTTTAATPPTTEEPVTTPLIRIPLLPAGPLPSLDCVGTAICAGE